MSKVVFVGNVPYNMGEEQLIDVFKSVGQVIGFRLVFDRETGKPRGYGFCEFTDHETAMSAVRNLNNVDVGGRPLRIDLADSDPFLEGKTTVRGEIIDSGESRAQWRERERDIPRSSGPTRNQDPNAFLASLPPGVPVPPGKTPPDVITQVLATMPPSQVIEVLAQMKAFVITHPEQARALLMAHPQLGYALFQAMIMHKILDEAIITRMQAAAAAAASRQPPSNVHTPTPPISAQPPFPPNMYGQPPPNMHQGQPPMPPPSMTMPPPMHGHPQMPPYPPQAPPSHVPPPHIPQAQPSYYAPPPPPPQHASTPTQAQAQVQQDVQIDPQQKAMLLQVLGMTQEQIGALDPAARDTVNRIRSQFFQPQGYSS